jgi:hypothetical protein
MIEKSYEPGDMRRATSPPQNPNHHLWRNGHRWWIHFTVHFNDRYQKDRKRFSLNTTNVREARRLRDQLLDEWPAANGCTLSMRLGQRRSETANQALERTR